MYEWFRYNLHIPFFNWQSTSAPATSRNIWYEKVINQNIKLQIQEIDCFLFFSSTKYIDITCPTCVFFCLQDGDRLRALYLKAISFFLSVPEDLTSLALGSGLLYETFHHSTKGIHIHQCLLMMRINRENDCRWMNLLCFLLWNTSWL